MSNKKKKRKGLEQVLGGRIIIFIDLEIKER